MNRKGFVLSTYVYMLLVFFLLLLTTMLAVMNNTKLLSNKLKDQTNNTSGLIDKDYSFILLGEGDMVIRKGEEYIEPGFKIQTSKGVDLSNIVSITGSVDVNSPNTYKLTYSATYNGITKRLTRNVTVLDNIASNYITGLYLHKRDENNLKNPKVTYEGTEYDTGTRYVGSNPNNYVYYNCEDTDASGVSYGANNYDYATSCEVWRIIGVFDTKSSENGTAEKRIKLINTASTFTASWDSSASSVNNGGGINQWGESGDYEGADLMRLLNGYYIGKSGATCIYCNGVSQSNCSQICTTEILISANMKPLTSKAKSKLENAVWDTYAVNYDFYPVTSSNANSSYLQEKGISEQYTGKICTSGVYCNDNIERTTSWTGLVGLMGVSDITYADGWLYNQSGSSLYPWSMSPSARSDGAVNVWIAHDGYASGSGAGNRYGVWPSLYLKSSIKITEGDGTQTNPYKLSI